MGNSPVLSIISNTFQGTMQWPTGSPSRLPKGRTGSTCILAGCTLQVVEAALCAESSAVYLPTIWIKMHSWWLVMYPTSGWLQSLRNHSKILADLAIFGLCQSKRWDRWRMAMFQPRFCKKSRLEQPKCHSIFPDHNFGSSRYPWLQGRNVAHTMSSNQGKVTHWYHHLKLMFIMCVCAHWYHHLKLMFTMCVCDCFLCVHMILYDSMT